MTCLTVGDILRSLDGLDLNRPVDILVDVISIKPELGLRVICDTFHVDKDEKTNEIIILITGDWNNKYAI